jgi:hypothetical protein
MNPDIFDRAKSAAEWHARQRSAGWETYSMLLDITNRLRLIVASEQAGLYAGPLTMRGIL